MIIFWLASAKVFCTIYSFEPDLNQRPMDICYYHLQSTALPAELSKAVGYDDMTIIHIYCNLFTLKYMY